MTEILDNFINLELKNQENVNLSPLANLPVELFLHICSFLDVRDIILTLTGVCKRFHKILNDENIWKSWIQRRYNAGNPLESGNEGYCWKSACLAVEKEYKLWSNDHDYYSNQEVHISTVDAVLLVNNGKTCITGSRDRTIVVWNVFESKNGRTPIQSQLDPAHDGWIWRFLNCGDVFYSCSWDNNIKGWSLDNNALVLKQSFKSSAPVLAMANLDSLIFAGDFSKKITAFDPRVGPDPVLTYTIHSKPVLTLGASKSCIISGSEDKTICVWDLRSKNLKQKIDVGNQCYGNCSSMDSNIIYIGDNKGRLHAFSFTNEELVLIKTLDLGHTKHLSALAHGRGYLISGSLDGAVKISIPSNPLQVLHNVRSRGGDVSGLDYHNGILAVGATNSVEFWIPTNITTEAL